MLSHLHREPYRTASTLSTTTTRPSRWSTPTRRPTSSSPWRSWRKSRARRPATTRSRWPTTTTRPGRSSGTCAITRTRPTIGANPSAGRSLDSPVVIVGDKNLSKVKPYLGDQYYEFPYRLIWWPRETYKGLTWQRIGRDPGSRAARPVLGRGHPPALHDPPAQWDPVHRFRCSCARMWRRRCGIGARRRRQVAAAAAPAKDPYAGPPQVSAQSADRHDRAAGQRRRPVQLPACSDGRAAGNIYVADSGNNRVQVFRPTAPSCGSGAAPASWIPARAARTTARGSSTSRGASRSARTAASTYPTRGTTASRSSTNDGQFVTCGASSSRPAASWASRSPSTARGRWRWAGRQHLRDGHGQQARPGVQTRRNVRQQWGGGGVVDGRFDEPVGLAQDADGNWYVADTWNHRIQQFAQRSSTRRSGRSMGGRANRL